jgi:hypothetical protein
MPAVAILGVYKDGPEATDPDVVRGKWSAWRIPSSSPRKVWKAAEGALNAAMRTRGYINVYVYYGDNLKIKEVLEVDQIEVYDHLSLEPGPSFYPTQRAYVWIRYSGYKKLELEMRRDDFREMELVHGHFSEETRPLGEPAWVMLRHTGLVFVRDPFIEDR